MAKKALKRFGRWFRSAAGYRGVGHLSHQKGGADNRYREPGFYPPIQPGVTQLSGDPEQGATMEAILFFVIWLGGAVLHTLFDLRIKPVLQSLREESDLP